jgi:hypothetical protein
MILRICPAEMHLYKFNKAMALSIVAVHVRVHYFLPHTRQSVTGIPAYCAQYLNAVLRICITLMRIRIRILPFSLMQIPRHPDPDPTITLQLIILM